MKQTLRAALLILFSPTAALAQNAPPAESGGPPVSFPQVTEIPIPLQSSSGRFSSLNPTGRHNCGYSGKVTGRAVSMRLMMVRYRFCGRGQYENLLVNIEFSNPADAMYMVPGRRVAITANFRIAEEGRTAWFFAEYLIAEKAALVAADPLDRSNPPVAFTSYMLCQPPDLDAFAAKLGRELCVQSTVVENLMQTAPALGAAARAPAQVSPLEAVSGDPVAITCRLDSRRSDIHLPAIACARNSYWAWYRTKWRDPFLREPAPP